MSTYIPISTQTLSSDSASITFNNIPQNYTDLILIASARRNITGSGGAGSFIINNDTGSNYSSTLLYNDGNTNYSFRWSNQSSILGIFTAGDGSYAPNIMQFQNYSSTTVNKMILSRFGFTGANSRVAAGVGLWRSTQPITSITLSATSNFAANSTFTLYGIGSGTAKATGGEIYINGGMAYHVFRQNGSFIPFENLTTDILVVAGGGSGGGGYFSGGGGAGGLLYHTSIPLSKDIFYIATVGSGGVGVDGTAGTSGSNSNLTGGSLAFTNAVGGGYGAGVGNNNPPAGSGGSGGGGQTSNGTGGLGTPGQGNNGGLPSAQTDPNNGGGGGGGGAGAVGGNAGTSTGGNGGIGTSTYSSWGAATSTGQNVSGTYYYAGGGAGTCNYGAGATPGTGGLGGGGNAGKRSSYSAVAGSTNTGGGGGAGGNEGSLPGNGGSGIVIVRYTL